MSDDPRTVASVETACEIIASLRRKEGARVSELAEAVDRTPGTVHTHLATLKQFALIHQEGTVYRLGPQFLTLGEHVRNQSHLYEAAREQIDELADVTGESVHLITQHDGRIYTMYEQFGSEAVGVKYHEKKRERPLHHLHCTAAGKAILAHMDETKLSEVLEATELRAETSKTITEVETLLAELEQIRESGVAFADEEQIKGICAVGAPVQDTHDAVLGAIAVSGPTTRLQDGRFRAELPDQVRHATSVTELNVQTSDH